MTLCYRAIVLAVLALGINPLSLAQTFPSKPVKIVVPFPPGGSGDLMARVIGQKLSEGWGQSVIVDNRPGGGTVIGTEAVARAPADGYTLLLMANSFTINAVIRASLPYDPNKDFAPVVLILISPQVLVVNPVHPAKTFAEFVALAKSEPGKQSYAAVGPATTQHIGGEMLWALTGVKMVYAPYAGGAPAVTALVGGHVDSVIANYSEVMTQIDAKRLRPLVVTSRERIEPLKDVPTVAESGYRDYDLAAWFGFIAPAGTPKDVIARINADVNRVLKMPEVRDKFIAQGLFPLGGTPEEMGVHIRSEMTKYAKVVKEAGIKVD